jgi:CHAD domain-containing protein
MVRGLHVLLANAEGLQESRDPELVHQSRVALRRMRSARRLLDRGLEDFPSGLDNELRWLGQTLGCARDWDVFDLSTLPSLLDAASEPLTDQARQVQIRTRRFREQANRDASAALASARFARLALQLQGWTLTPPPKGRSLRRHAPSALARAHTELFDAARFFAALSPERRHRVRILAKRLRYALDVFAVALPAQPTRVFVERLAALQDELGALNDAAVSRRLLAEVEGGSELLGTASAGLDAREQTELRKAEERLLELSMLERPWSAKS